MLWDAVTGKLICSLRGGDQEALRTAVFSRDGKRVVSVSVDRASRPFEEKIATIRTWDALTGEQLASREFRKDVAVYTSRCLSSDGERLVTETPKELQVSDANGTHVFSVARTHSIGDIVFSPDSLRVAFHCGDKVEIAGKQECIHMLITGRPNLYLAFSGDGKLLAGLTRYTGRITVWDSRTGEQVHELVAPDAICFALNPDGKRVATLHSADGRVKLWDVANGQEVLTLKSERALGSEKVAFSEGHLAFSPDGEKLAVWLGYQHIEIFDAPHAPPKLFAGE
jgi:WD40 repeat protein